jgi:aspartate aminotransferase-like enzyme
VPVHLEKETIVEDKQLLMIPGPTPCPASVLLAHANPMINHRGPKFKSVLNEVTANLQKVFRTQNDIFILTSSGTGAMETSIVNTLSPGDKVLCLSIGNFGNRYAKIARTFGADVEKMDFPLGTAVDVEKLRARLADDKAKEFKAVLVQFNETSTGVVNPIPEIAAAVHEHGAMILVDAVSGLGAIDLDVDGLGLDVVCAGSQKAFMCPPGLAFVSFSERALKAAETAKMPRFYFDALEAKKYLATGETPWTPAIPQFFGMQVGLRLIMQEGLDKFQGRHLRLRNATRAAVKALGLKLLVDDDSIASPVITAIFAPEAIGPDAIRKLALTKYGAVYAVGQDALKSTVFRIGHLGYVDDTDVLAALGVLGSVLVELGFSCDPAAGVVAAQQSITKALAQV